jgi:hypothetical protein
MTYAIRAIRLTFQLGQGNFGTASQKTVVISGLRVQANIVKTGSMAMGEAHLRIHGLTPNVLNALTAIYTVPQFIRQNTVTIEAGDAISGYATVFTGGIVVAQADLNQQPDSVLNVVAQAGLIWHVSPADHTSYPGEVSIDTVLMDLVGRMNLITADMPNSKITYKNYGVTGTLSTQSLRGSLRDQVLQAIQAVGCDWNGLDGNVLAITPKNGNVQPSDRKIPIISPNTGMIGYPAYSSIGVMVKTIFNPNILFLGQIQVESSLKQANYVWTVFGLSYDLESETPNGQWFTEVHGFSTQAISAS